ncbi:MAG: hypothetical protein U0931_13465 [Vulcanimicrobiota bacterium]
MSTVNSFSLPPIVYKPIPYTPVQRSQPAAPSEPSQSVATDLVSISLPTVPVASPEVVVPAPPPPPPAAAPEAFKVESFGVTGSTSGSNPQTLMMLQEPAMPAVVESDSLAQARATTENTAALLSQLEAGQATGNLREGFEKVRNQAWDRFNGALAKLPPEAQDSYKNLLTLTVSEFSQDEKRSQAYLQAAPDLQAEYRYGWAASAAQTFANKPVDAMVANGQFAMLDPALVKDLGDGASQYLRATSGFLGHNLTTSQDKAEGIQLPEAVQKGLGLNAEQAAQLGGMVTGEQKPERAGRLPNGDSFLITFQFEKNEQGNHYRYYSVSADGVKERPVEDEMIFRGSGSFLTLADGERVSIGRTGVKVGEQLPVEEFDRSHFAP